jgi:hypothetical protein
MRRKVAQAFLNDVGARKRVKPGLTQVSDHRFYYFLRSFVEPIRASR